MLILTFLATLLFSLTVRAQINQRPQESQPYTDPVTGIEFEGLVHGSGLRAGFVVSKNATTDALVQILAPISNGDGWAGLVFGPGMMQHLIVAAWGNGKEVVASFRRASDYTSPEVWNGTATMTPIKKGTYLNETYLSYTFLCKKCITTDGFSLAPGNEPATLGWAVSTSPVAESNNTATELTFHAGFGLFSQNMARTKSSKYETYAALAV